MADTHGDFRQTSTTEPTHALSVPLRPTTDGYITCIVCAQDRVDFEFYSRTPSARQFQGLHRRCAESMGNIVKTS